MNVPFKIVFSLRASVKGDTYIQYRIYMNGSRSAPRTTGYRINKADWDSRKQLPREGAVPDVTAGLMKLKTRLTELYLRDQPESPEAMRRLAAESSAPVSVVLSLLDVVEAYQKNRERAYSTGKLKLSTLKTYRTYRDHLANHLKKLRYHSLTLQEFTLSKAELLEESIRAADGSKKFAISTGSKVMAYLKHAISWGVASGFGTRNGMQTLKLPMPHRRTKPLTADQLTALICLPLTDQVQIGVRRRFLLQCATGLNWSDVDRLEELAQRPLTSDGLEFVQMHRQKEQLVGDELVQTIWLSDTVKALLHGGVYQTTNKTANAHLKVLGAAVGYENLTTKVARTTWSQDVVDTLPEEIVKQLGGWSKSQTISKHYAQPSLKRISREIIQSGYAQR